MKVLKSAFYATLILCVSYVLVQAKAKMDNYKVNVSKSTVNWIGKKVGGEHSGTIAIKSGNLLIANNILIGGAMNIDMNSLTCTDLTGKEYNGKLVGHLKSADFFGTEKFPMAKLKITKIKALGNGVYDVTADLTIKGIKKPNSFKVTLSEDGTAMNVKSQMIIDRTLYGIKYGTSLVGTAQDKLIDDKFILNINLVTSK